MLLWIVIAPVVIGVLLFFFSYRKPSRVFAIISQALIVCASIYIFLLSKEESLVFKIGGYEGVMGIILRSDGISSVLVMLTSVVFLFIAFYCFNEDNGRLFWFLLYIWEGLLFGLFLSGDIFNIFVLLEVVTVVVSILIMLKRDNRSMYDGMIYLMVNTVAIQFYLFGLGLLYKLTGVLDLEAASAAVKGLEKSALILPYALIITSISLKCALMPLFSWLPKAHGTPGAPSAVSAILSGLHIKSGIYLFIRFQSLFSEIALTDFFLITGIITGIAGFVLALSQTDIKLILAYHTISQIGMIMIGLNGGNIYSYTGGIYHIISHTLFKSSLFLCAGVVFDAYGTREISKIRGVLRRLPIAGTAALLAIFGITGAPFFNGSISKYFIMSGSNFTVNAAIILINCGTIVSFIKFSAILFGRIEGGQEKVKIDVSKQIALLLLSSLCLAGGILGEQFILFLFNINVSVDAMDYLQKTVFFIVSVIAGFLVYKYIIRKNRFFNKIRELELSFRGICVSIGVFFAVLLIITRLLLV